MKRSIVALALASTIASSAAAHPVAPAALVSASRHIESTIAIAFVNPHAPVSIETAAQALAADANRERAARGIAPLARDTALDRFAVAKATDMAAHGYFGHTSPDGVSFQTRMQNGRWPTQYVGENIAFDVDEPAAQRAFVTSPPHLANLIDPKEHRIGVAVVTVAAHETFYVEDFSE